MVNNVLLGLHESKTFSILSVVSREMLSYISLELCLFEERHVTVIAEGWPRLDGSRGLKPLPHGTMIMWTIYHSFFFIFFFLNK